MLARLFIQLHSQSRCFIHTARDHFFPKHCLACHAPAGGMEPYFCQNCWQELQTLFEQHCYCHACGRSAGPYSLTQGRCTDCLNRRGPLREIVRIGEYRKPLNQIILAFKFAGRTALDEFLGTLLAQELIFRGLHQRIDILMPIPLHWFRYCMRRYNQSELLARQVFQIAHQQEPKLVYSDELIRTRYTTPQTQLPQSRRKTNLKDAFDVRRPRILANKHICLIDDVTTSGTTLRAAARTLLQAGAASVSAAVLAVAAPQHT